MFDLSEISSKIVAIPKLPQPEDFDFPLNRPEVWVGRYQLRLFLLAGH